MGILVLTASTSGAEIGVATSNQGNWAITHVERTERRRGRDLLALVKRATIEAGIRRSDLRGVIVDRGPGSFTGVRLAVTVAKTLGYALSIPVTPVNSLEAMAASPASRRPTMCVVDAGRGTCYAGIYGGAKSDDASHLAVRFAPARVPDADVIRLSHEHRCLTPNPEQMVQRMPSVSWSHAAPRAEGVLAAGIGRHTETFDGSSVHALVPLYLQASAPEQKLDAPNSS